MKGFAGRVAAVSGAGSGIGRALALELAARRAHVAIADIDEAGLAETVALVEQADARVHVTRADVADRASVAAWAAAVADHFGVVHQLYNNAGIGATPLPVLEMSYESLDRVVGVNLWGVVHGTKEFLPHLIASGDGHLVNVSSLNGIMAQPGLSGYCATKFAVRGFTESVRAEMRLAGHPVGVTVVHPGGIRTNISANAFTQADVSAAEQERLERRAAAYDEKLFTMTAGEAAAKILHGVARGRGRVLLAQATWVDRVVRALPARYPGLVVRWERRAFG